MAKQNIQYQNSAGRLLAALKLANKQKDYLAWGGGELNPESASQDYERRTVAMDGIVRIARLYAEFMQDMRDLNIPDKQRDVLLRGLAGIQNIISHDQLRASCVPINEAQAAILEVCATMLPHEEPMTSDDLTEIRRSISTLRDIVKKGDISATLRKSLLELIHLTEVAISRYEIEGAKGLKKAFKQMLGESMELFAPNDEATAEELKKTGIGAVIVNHLRTIDGVASRIIKYKPFIDWALKLLPENRPQLDE